MGAVPLEEIDIEKRRRIRVSLLAYAYEVENDPLVSDSEFDQLCKEVRPKLRTGNKILDEFFKKEFSDFTGSWVHRHPEFDKLRSLYYRVKGKNSPVVKAGRIDIKIEDRMNKLRRSDCPMDKLMAYCEELGEERRAQFHINHGSLHMAQKRASMRNKNPIINLHITICFYGFYLQGDPPKLHTGYVHSNTCGETFADTVEIAIKRCRQHFEESLRLQGSRKLPEELTHGEVFEKQS